jgi:hypothetical protein
MLATAPWLEFTAPERFDRTIRGGFRQFNPDPWEDSWADEEAAAENDDLVETINR